MSNTNNNIPDNIMDQASDWVARLQSDLATEADRQQFQAWLEASPDHRHAYSRISALWGDLEQAVQMSSLNEDIPLAQVSNTDNAFVRPAHRFGSRWFISAAAAISLSLAGVLSYTLLQQESYSTQTGEQKRVTLSDGSTVHMNTRSRINVGLQKENRLLELKEGEALFKVAHDQSRPFIVNTGEICVQAVGTAFNIYKKQNQTTTITVIEGKIRIGKSSHCDSPLQNHDDQFLEATQQIHFANQHGLSTIEKVDTSKSITWTKQQLIYDGVPLQEVLKELNRYTQDEIRPATDQIAELKVSGVLKIQNQETIIKSLESVFGLKALRLSNGILELRKAYF